MTRFNNIKIIREFTQKDDGRTYGVYLVNFKGKEEVFIRNHESVGVVSHYYGKPASECVSIIRDDVRQEFFKELDLLKET
jgi:hypothetical protein